MSKKSKKSQYDAILDFTEQEVSKLQEEIAYLLETPATEEEIERIARRVDELEKIFYNSNLT